MQSEVKSILHEILILNTYPRMTQNTIKNDQKSSITMIFRLMDVPTDGLMDGLTNGPTQQRVN